MCPGLGRESGGRLPGLVGAAGGGHQGLRAESGPRRTVAAIEQAPCPQRPASSGREGSTSGPGGLPCGQQAGRVGISGTHMTS